MAQVAPPIANGMIILITYKLMQSLNNQSDEMVKQGKFKLLPILHHITAGVKALGSEMMYVGMDELRQSCGGAGFSLASGISSLWLNSSPVPTFEGVNVLMFQQSARILLRELKKLEKGKKATGLFAYMNDSQKFLQLKCKASSTEDFLKTENLLECLQVRACFHIAQVHAAIKASGVSQNIWMNELIAVDLERMIRAHLILLMYQGSLQVLAGHKFTDLNVPKVLTLLTQLFAVTNLRASHTALYETGFFKQGSAALLDGAFKKLLVDLRPHMLGLVEWF